MNDDDVRGQRERVGAPVSEANAVAGETLAPSPHDPSTDAPPDLTAFVCLACDGDGDLIDNLGDGEHVRCLGCGHTWAPLGHADEHKTAVEVGCTACDDDPPSEPTEWPDECDMRLWKAEVDGATYWVAADSMMDALTALADQLGDEGMTTALEPVEVSISLLSVGKAWRALLTSEDPPGRQRMFNAVVELSEKQEASEPVVLACSEWP